MNEAAAYIKKQQPDIICFQEAPDNGYYHPDSIRQAFAYAPYRSISRRTDHSPVAIYSRYPIHQVKTTYYKNSWNMSMIADIRINDRHLRVINNHFETTSVNAYRGIITAPGKTLKVRVNEPIKPSRSTPRSSAPHIRSLSVATSTTPPLPTPTVRSEKA